MTYVIFGLIGLILLLLAARWFVSANSAKLAVQIKRISGIVLILLAAYAAYARFWIFALMLFGFGLTLLGFGNFRNVHGGWGTRSVGQSSTVRSAILEMNLDHDSGELQGRVLAGNFEGSELSQLSNEQLETLWNECCSDDESRALLEAYLEKRIPDWRVQFGEAKGAEYRSNSSEVMSRDEAFEILGLKPGAGTEEIREAHKRLIGKLHPDLGGSNFLAAKINQAKDVLLG